MLFLGGPTMPTPHINAKEHDFAPIVLMPGDPKRAEYIAQNFLTDAKLVNTVRGVLGYTGKTKNGYTISVMASGMGMPSIGIYCRELFTSYHVDAIIRIGTMGTYQENVKLRDVIIAEGSCTDSNWMGQWNLFGGTYSAIADFDLLEKAANSARALKKPFHVGNIVSCDIFYDHRPDNWKKWANLGILGVEMESYALYQTAAELRKKALCLCTVTDSFINNSEKLTSEQRQTGLNEMIEIAIKTAEEYLKCQTK